MERLRSEEGFGLIELLIAMTVLAVGLSALLATYSAGYVTLQRASRQGTASALADRTLEALRGKQYANVAVGTTTTPYDATTSPDGRSYTVVARVVSGTATNTAVTAVKVVTVTVTDASGRTGASQRALLDPLTG